MNSSLSKLAVIVPPDETIDVVIRRMAAESREVVHAGLAVVLDTNSRVCGVLTDGDIRRAYARGVSWGKPVSEIMIDEPITLPVETNVDQIIVELSRRVEDAAHLKAKTIKHILLVDTSRRLVDIKDFVELLWDREEKSARVHVIGMGFVGLTLAVTLANVGHRVTGVDVKTELIEKLRDGKSNFFERGLEAKLRHVIDRHLLEFNDNLVDSNSSIYIIAVGTPVDENFLVSLDSLRQAAKELASVLVPGDQVMLRSTVPVGTTRELLLPILQDRSGLKVPEELNLVFAPERTLAGMALKELHTLPQLVGGVTPRCSERAARFWNTITQTVVQLPSAEGAEIAKLANNSFRNASFAFSNDLVHLADQYNLDVNELIRAANNGYPRDTIPVASPGVGGYCLPKDAILLNTSFDSNRVSELSKIAREVNEITALYPVKVVKKYCVNVDMLVALTSVLVIGIAFKGEPETSDLRGSTGVKVAHCLSGEGATVKVWDAVATSEEINETGLQGVVDVQDGLESVNIVLVMNNHRQNSMLDFSRLGKHTNKPKLVFDGWGLLDRKDIEALDGFYYATLGYMTNR